MSQFLESIKYHSGFYNLELHQSRIDDTFKAFFSTQSFDIREHMQGSIPTDDDLYKLRITYDDTSVEANFSKYQKRIISTFKIVKSNFFNYRYKFLDRSIFKELSHELKQDEEMILCQDGFLTDASYANIALYKEGIWYTPATPLLNGTKRQYLINQGLLNPIPITQDDLYSFEKISLINAMLDLDEITLSISSDTIHS